MDQMLYYYLMASSIIAEVCYQLEGLLSMLMHVHVYYFADCQGQG